MQHFCENINTQINLHYAIGIITKLIKFSSNENKYDLVETLFATDFESKNRVDYNIELSNFRSYLESNETKLNEQIEKLEHYSYHDALTGLQNRRSHDDNVVDEIAKINRT
jgi:PleD family two-component response regulator